MVTSLLKHTSSILASARRSYSHFPLSVSHQRLAVAREQLAGNIRQVFFNKDQLWNDNASTPLNRIKDMKDDAPLAAPDVCHPLNIMARLSKTGDIEETVIFKANSDEAAIKSLLDIQEAPQTLRTMAYQFNQLDHKSKPKYYQSYRQGKSEEVIRSDLAHLETMFQETLNNFGVVFKAYYWKLTGIDKRANHSQFSEARTELLEHYEAHRKFFRDRESNSDNQHYLLFKYSANAEKRIAALIEEVKPLWQVGTKEKIIEFKKLEERFNEHDLIGAAKILQKNGVDIYATNCISLYNSQLKLVNHDKEERKLNKFKLDITTDVVTALRRNQQALPSSEQLLVTQVALSSYNSITPLADITSSRSR